MDAGTALTYSVQAQVGGKLAQIGARLIDGVAKKMADEFFKRFTHVVAGPADASDAAATDTAIPADAAAKPASRWWSKS
ncbi:Uncharacterized conserved protein [Mycobacteroides abscessus subsp. abscessus]|nr:Uncharacterized conserved protein [Mycobacteroides abscessus subsp. abscessus]